MGIMTTRTKGDAEAIPFYKRAIELDPNFAVAYASSGTIVRQSGTGQSGSREFEEGLRSARRVSEREKYRISAMYYDLVTGELEEATQVYELWAKSYPSDAVRPVILA